MRAPAGQGAGPHGTGDTNHGHQHQHWFCPQPDWHSRRVRSIWADQGLILQPGWEGAGSSVQRRGEMGGPEAGVLGGGFVMDWAGRGQAGAQR